jgi:aquaporin Z
MLRRFAAEFVGTFALVLFAVGSAVGGIDRIGAVGVALAFGFVLLALVYTIGPISGCHVNPAVTLGVLLSRGMTAAEAGVYVLAQFLGGILGAAGIALMTTVGGVADQTGGLGTNTWGKTINGTGAFLLEVALTAALVFVVLRVTSADGDRTAPGFAGLAIGLTLALVHLVGIPLDSTSVNPARSFGPALFAGGQALGQVWLFILAPLVGGLIAAGLFRLLPATRDARA